MPRPFALVDAFTAEAYRGNPAVVFLLPHWPADQQLLMVAREMNQSETAFAVRRGDHFELRWFTPAIEVDLCGHATLAAAHYLWEIAAAETGLPITFSTRSGRLIAAPRGERIELDFPLIEQAPQQLPEELREALGVAPVYTGKGRFDWLVEVATEREVLEACPNFDRLGKAEGRGFILTAKASNSQGTNSPKYDFLSRFFAPAAGINEDPVTGSAHCCLAGYWASKLGKPSMLGYQASQRGGEVAVEVRGDRVLLGGAAITIFTGQLLAPLLEVAG